MQILLGLMDGDIAAIRKMRAIADIRYRELIDKEAAGSLTEEEETELDDWCCRYELFHRMEALVDNQIALYRQTLYANGAGNAAQEEPPVLEMHGMRMERQREHDRRVRNIVRKVMDVSVLNNQEKSSKAAAGSHSC